MKKFLLFVLGFAGIGILFSLQACKGNDTAKAGEMAFDYFPAKNVYYNAQTSTYIYSLDGAKTWDSLKAGKEGFTLLGRKERIYTNFAEVWKENETHLKMYEGKALIVPTDFDQVSTTGAEEVSDKRTIIRATSVKKDPPKKKGVRGFLDRVFKKKDKK